MAATGQRRPTMRDVAHEAGVSFKTVSRVVNREDGVSPELAERVEKSIESLGYRPDGRAQTLRQRGTRTGAIGFVMVDVANPFFSSILRGIEDVAHSEHCLVLAGSTDGQPDRERQLLDALVSRRVDGLIVVPTSADTSSLRSELRRGTPIVFLDIEPAELTVDLVRSDHFGGAVAATRHLVAHGHRDIALFSDTPTVFSARQRIEGFRHALAEAGLSPEPGRIVTGRHTAQEWATIVERHLAGPTPPTALFSAQNFISIGAATALHRLGMEHRIAHVGFDDVELAGVLSPGITVVPQDASELGRRAAELLFTRIAGSTAPPYKIIISCPLIERGSGEIRPS